MWNGVPNVMTEQAGGGGWCRWKSLSAVFLPAARPPPKSPPSQLIATRRFIASISVRITAGIFPCVRSTVLLLVRPRDRHLFHLAPSLSDPERREGEKGESREREREKERAGSCAASFSPRFNSELDEVSSLGPGR